MREEPEKPAETKAVANSNDPLTEEEKQWLKKADDEWLNQ